MADCLTRFNEAIVRETAISSLIPKGLCPFLYYNLGPYIFTLVQGGYFKWVKQRSGFYRKPVADNDFQRKNVNRLYPNEVLIRCPNPDCNVVAGVGPYLNHTIKIRVLQSTDSCPYKQKKQEEIILNQEGICEKILAYNVRFAELLLAAYQVFPKKEDRCFLGEQFRIQTSTVFFPCRYHTRKTGVEQSSLPSGFCIHLFQSLYPYILAKMYNANIPEPIEQECPFGHCHFSIFLKKRYFPGRQICNLIEKTFGLFLYPVDIINYNFDILISSITAGHKSCLLTEGKEYPLNLTLRNFMCPAALHAAYPYLIARKYHLSIWNNRVACPDCIGAIYSISRCGQEEQ